MKRIAIFVFGVILCATSAFANKCDWATNTPNDDVKYKYFVAKTYSDTSASDAANKAERDIDSQLGRLFGVALNVQSDFYADETTSAGTTRSYERSIGTLSLKGLERQKSDVDKESGGWVGCVQYRYSQQEFQKEKQRLAKSPASATANIVFTEVAGDTTCRGAPVEIITTPTNAFVTLDDGKYQGTSPIKFGNVCNGKHTLEITKENYANIQEKLIVQNKVKISKTLKRDTKLITVHTSLGNSKITINGIDYGAEPVKFNAPLGIEQTITATNPEATKITKARTFSKYSNSEYTIDMDKLPGKIDFSAFKKRNPGVSISVDGTKITGNTTGELSPDYEHIVVLSKKDFVDISEYTYVTGGKTTYYASGVRTFSKDGSNWAQGRLAFAGLAFLGGTYSNYDTSVNAGFELGTRVRINNKFGIRAAFGLQWAEMDLQPTNITYDYYKYQFKPLTKGTNCPSGKTCQNATFYLYGYDSSHNETFWGYFSDVDNPVVSPKEQVINWSYNEPFYGNLGIIAYENVYIYGIGAIGFLSGETKANRYLSATTGTMRSTVFRFGAGAQINLGKLYGVRMQYLTSGGRLKLPYNFNNQPAYIGSDYRDSYTDPDYVWLHRGEVKNATGQRTIDAIESFSLSFFIGF